MSILRQNAKTLLERFRSHDLSPVEVMQEVIDGAEATEDRINAFTDTYFENAIEEAKRAEKAYASGSAGPLQGLPLAVKDDTPVAGRITTGGSVFRSNHMDSETSPSVQRLMDAGAIVHARTACPEFVWAWTCSSKLHGVTRNPWNTDCTPGGSSGGSGAALAAGSTFLATGTDSAGSIRHPAALCGVVGFKPPYGRNPATPGYSFDYYNHIGPMARSVGDCALMQNVMSGQHPKDHTTVPQDVALPTEPDSIRDLKIAWSPDLGCYNVSEDILSQTCETVAALKDAGATFEQVDMPWAEKAVDNAGHHGDLIYRKYFEDAVATHPDDLSDYTPYFAEKLREVTPDMFSDSVRVAGETWANHFGPLLEKYDAFICPTTTCQEIPAEMKAWETINVNGREMDLHDTTMTILFNMFSRCPVLAVPSGTTSSGMPTGIQIVGPPFDDIMVFRIGLALEAIRPWEKTAPP